MLELSDGGEKGSMFMANSESRQISCPIQRYRLSDKTCLTLKDVCSVCTSRYATCGEELASRGPIPASSSL